MIFWKIDENNTNSLLFKTFKLDDKRIVKNIINRSLTSYKILELNNSNWMICWKRDSNNIGDLENRFDDLNLYLKDIGRNDTICWKEETQYLDFKNESASRKVLLAAFLNGNN